MLTLTLRFDRAPEGLVSVLLEGDDVPPAPIRIEALRLPAEGFIRSLLLDGGATAAEDGLIRIPSAPFRLTYEITSRYERYVGDHVDFDVSFPVFNPHEAHLGSGTLPVLEGFEARPESYSYRVRLEGIPKGWQACSNLPTMPGGGVAVMEQVEQAFVHVSDGLRAFDGGRFRYVVGRGVELPVSPERIFEHCRGSIEAQERAFGPNPKIKDLLILHLQAPKGFKQLTGGMTRATGQNYTGGIALYGSDEIENYGPLGHPDYLDFVLFGLHHEIGHAWTSAGPAKFKSLLYASDRCPRNERFLIGERLNGYFNSATRLLFEPGHPFTIRGWVEGMLASCAKGRPYSSIDLFLFDCGLRAHSGVTLADVFREMLDEKRRTPSPYDSIDFLFEAARRSAGREVPETVRRKLTSPNIETYAAQIRASLGELGTTIEGLPSDREGTARFLLGIGVS